MATSTSSSESALATQVSGRCAVSAESAVTKPPPPRLAIWLPSGARMNRIGPRFETIRSGRSSITRSLDHAPSAAASRAALCRGDDDVLEELALPPPRAPVDVAPAPLFDRKPRLPEDPVVQRSGVVDHDHEQATRPGVPPGVLEHGRRVADVLLDHPPADALLGGADLVRPQVVQSEQCERVAVLLVIADPARVGRRGDDPVEHPATEVERSRVAVDDRAGHRLSEGCVLPQPADRVDRIAAQELLRLPRRRAGAAVLVA